MLASAWSELGLLAEVAGDSDGAIHAFGRAIAELRAVPHDGPEGARVRSDLAREADGRQPRRRRDRARARGPRGGAEVFAGLGAEHPGLPDARFRRARAPTNQAADLGTLGRHDEGFAAAREALALQAGFAADFPGVPGFVDDLARTHVNLSAIHGRRGEFAECEAALDARSPRSTGWSS